MLLPLALTLAALAGAPHVTLPAGAVDGVPVLGASVPRVEAALGLPDHVEHFARRRDLVYGPRARPRLEVIFAGPFDDPTAETAWAVLVADPAATFTGAGQALAVPPQALERRLRRLPLRETRRYRCDPAGCFGTFLSHDRKRRMIYGLQHGSRYLGVQVWPNP